MIRRFPGDKDVYYRMLNGDIVVVDCMGESLTFFTGFAGSRNVMDTFMFIAEFDPMDAF